MLYVFNRMDTDKKGSLTFSQFEKFLRYNCFDFILDFYDREYLQKHLFNQESGISPGE